jgi:hypothetical protein
MSKNATSIHWTPNSVHILQISVKYPNHESSVHIYSGFVKLCSHKNILDRSAYSEIGPGDSTTWKLTVHERGEVNGQKRLQ